MSSCRARKAVAGVLGVVAVILALSSAAFACTVWAGQMTVTAVSTGGGNGSSGAVTGYGANMISGLYQPGAFPQGAGSSMQYCNGAQPTGEAKVDQNPTTRLGTIQVTVAGSTCAENNVPYVLGSSDAGVWTVNWIPNPSYDCMKGQAIGTFTVGVNDTSVTTLIEDVPNLGFDSTTTPGGYRMDAGKAAICADAPSIRGMQVPITVL